jgi:hypothetical protein
MAQQPRRRLIGPDRLLFRRNGAKISSGMVIVIEGWATVDIFCSMRAFNAVRRASPAPTGLQAEVQSWGEA